MKLRFWKHTGVKPDGTFYKKRGAIETKPSITESTDKGNCGLDGCHCSDGHWICIGEGLKGRTVKGYTLEFDSLKEKNDFKKTTMYKAFEVIIN